MTPRRKRIAVAAGVTIVAAALAFAVWLIDPPEAAAMPSTNVNAAQVRSLIASVMAGSGIPLWFATANCQLESAFNARAHRGGNEDSFGLMQINFRAHKQALVRYGVTEGAQLFDPGVNLGYWKDLVMRLAGQEGATAADPASWEKIRLRLAGIRRANFGGATAAGILGRYRPVAAKWLAELGA